MKRNEEIGVRLIQGDMITRDDIVYLQKYFQDNGEVWSETKILSTDYVKLPLRYRHLQTSLLRRGYTVTGKRPAYKRD